MRTRTVLQQSPIAVPGTYLHGCLLLLLSESPNYGYDLVERLATLGLTHVDSGTVYRALRRLNDEGLVHSWWEESESGPARRRYGVTAEGAAGLEACASTVAESSRSLGFFLARQRRLARRAEPVAAHG